MGQLLERLHFPEDSAFAAVGEFGLVVDLDRGEQTSRPVESLLDRGVGTRAKVAADLVVADLGEVEGLELGVLGAALHSRDTLEHLFVEASRLGEARLGLRDLPGWRRLPLSLLLDLLFKLFEF